MDKKQLKNTLIIQIVLYLLIVIEASKWNPTKWDEIQLLHYIAYSIFNIVWNQIMAIKI